MKNLSLILIAFTVLGSNTACKTQKETTMKSDELQLPLQAEAPIIIYKTKGDYVHLVPIQLSEDKTKITSYPHPRDVIGAGNELMEPIVLESGYLLDRRGITVHSAFLDITYQEFAKLAKAPAMDEMLRGIKEKDPMQEIFYCGKYRDFQNLVKDLNRIIREEKLDQKFKRIK